MNFAAMLARLARVQTEHPLVLFLLLGTFLMGVDGFRHRPPLLVLPGASIQTMNEEALYREALARNLGQGDLIVRRRLIQKMRQLLETGLEVPEPTQQALQAWMDRSPANYGGGTLLRFDHVFLSSGMRGSNLTRDSDSVRLSLLDAKALTPTGDPHPLAGHIDWTPQAIVERDLGEELTRQLQSLPPDTWQGPFDSSIGLHFLRLTGRKVRPPDYEANRARARQDFLVAERERRMDKALTHLRQQFGMTAEAGP